jgi:arabinogalactan endo-1,4-beta-galactosidase
MNIIQIGLLLLLAQMYSCKASEEEPVPRDSNIVKIANYSFENGGASQEPAGWKTVSSGNSADADFTMEGGRLDEYCLSHSKSSAYKVTTSQALSGLDNGYYSLTAWIKNSGGQEACYMFASGFGDSTKMTSFPVSLLWTQVIIRGIYVSNGKCTIGFLSDANAGNWCRMDEVKMIRDGIPYDFLKGGDISELSYIESMGGKFFENGTEKNCLDILKTNGFNIVRLRLYNDPGNPDFTPSNRLPAGFQDPDDILYLARRAKEQGMQILLTFYYSDYWSNGKPHLWQDVVMPALGDSVYTYSLWFMNRMKAQGTVPDFVSLGNEIQGGILNPVGSSGNFPVFAELLKQGYRAVKEVSTSTKVVLHLDDGGNKEKYDWFCGACKDNGLSYDIIGASYYPFWTKKTVKQVIEWGDYISEKYNKDILIMECGYNWNPTLPDGKAGQLSNNGPYDPVYESSPAGQRDFLFECFNGMKLVKKGGIIGILYWDPVMIEVPGVGWELGGDNVVSNTTLFDFGGNALPSLKAFKYNN